MFPSAAGSSLHMHPEWVENVWVPSLVHLAVMNLGRQHDSSVGHPHSASLLFFPKVDIHSHIPGRQAAEMSSPLQVLKAPLPLRQTCDIFALLAFS